MDLSIAHLTQASQTEGWRIKKSFIGYTFIDFLDYFCSTLYFCPNNIYFLKYQRVYKYFLSPSVSSNVAGAMILTEDLKKCLWRRVVFLYW